MEELGQGGYFGRVLQLVRERRARAGELRALLRQVVGHLETMPDEERSRWQELFSYISALVYHERVRSEQPSLQEALDASLRTDEHRQRVTDMRRMIADMIGEEASARALQQALLRQVRQRFGDLPEAAEQTIQRTTNIESLNTWLDRVLVVKTLDEMGIQDE